MKIVKINGYYKVFSQNRRLQLDFPQNQRVQMHPLTRSNEGPAFANRNLKNNSEKAFISILVKKMFFLQLSELKIQKKKEKLRQSIGILELYHMILEGNKGCHINLP